MVRRRRTSRQRPTHSTSDPTRHDRRNKIGRENGPRIAAGAASPLIGRIPDHGEHAVVVVAGGAAEIGLELARSELGRGKRKAHIILA